MMRATKLRVLVVDDSAFMRQLISNAINASEDMQVIGLARNGQEAVSKALELCPDVITMDVEMPVMSGIEALARIMREAPTPVVMISNLTVEGARETLSALEAGAVDFVSKPQQRTAVTELAEAITPKIRAAALAHLKRVGSSDHKKQQYEMQPTALGIELVVLGCSTGGPAALQRIIPELPQEFPAPIVVAQHIPVGFTGPMAQRLAQRSKVKVLEGVSGVELEPGTVYIAPAGSHSMVKKQHARKILEVLPPDAVPGPYRPSVNALFLSAQVFAPHVLAMVLTGMGQDGLEGVRLLHSKGCHIIAESEETAVIYGMPRAVVESKLAHRVLTLQQIIESLSIMVKK